MTSAFDLRHRLPPAERLLAEVYYYSTVAGDRDATVRAYELLLEVDPDNTVGLNNLALEYWYLGRFEDAEALFEKRISVGPPSSSSARVPIRSLDRCPAAA